MTRKKLTKSALILLLVFALLVQTAAIATPAPYEFGDLPDIGEDVLETEHLPDLSEIIAQGTLIDSRTFYVPDYSERVIESEWDGDYSHRNEALDEDGREVREDIVAFVEAHFPHFARSGAFQLFGATRSDGTTATANTHIADVRVLDGGAFQSRWRDQIGNAGHQGHTVSQGASGYWYTTARGASLTDRRLFAIATRLTAAEAAALNVSDPNFLDRISVTYGDLPLSAWRTGANFNQAGSFIGVEDIQLFNNADGSYTIISFVQFNSPYASRAGTGTNVPFDGFRGPTAKAGFPFAMRHVVGTYDIAIRVDSDVVGQVPVRLNLYDDFMLWDEIDAWARELQTEAGPNNMINDRYVNVSSIGQSYMGREMWNVVIAADQDAIDHYKNVTLPLMRSNPAELRQQIAAGNLQGHRLPIYFSNNHPDEVTGVDASIVMVEQLIRDSIIRYAVAAETNEVIARPIDLGDVFSSGTVNHVHRVGTDTNTVEIDVDAILEQFIFIFTPTNNPDGRYWVRRGNIWGADLNRDAAFQVQQENRYMITNALSWSPAIMLEFHGHITSLLIEPTSPPHHPNYELDLKLPMMIRLAHAMGEAAISGGFRQYNIPAVHRNSGWDAAGPMYTPLFLSHFGILGFTLEIPDISQCSLDANLAMGWAAVTYAGANFDELFDNKLQQMYRGVNNIDAADLVDPFYVNPFIAAGQPGRVAGRPRQEGRSFFPDYYVIPVDAVNQRNAYGAYNMIEMLKRHQIHVDRLTIPVTTADGTTYPAGTFIVDMRQAFRGGANLLLSYGYDVEHFGPFTGLYAESVVNHPRLRGFNSIPLWEPGVFDGATERLKSFATPAAQLPEEDTAYVLLRNVGVDTIRLVNLLLDAGEPVWMVTHYVQEGRIGDFVVQRADLTGARLEGLFIEAAALPDGRNVERTEQLIRPRIAISMWGPDTAGTVTSYPRRTLGMEMGFDYVWAVANTPNAEVALVPGPTTFNPVPTFAVSQLVADPQGVNIVVNGRDWAQVGALVATHNLPIINFERLAGWDSTEWTAQWSSMFTGRGASSVNVLNTGARQGLFRASYSPASMLTAHFDDWDTVYLFDARSFANIPTNTFPLYQTAAGTRDEVFIEGFIQGQNWNNLQNRVFAFTGTMNNGREGTTFAHRIAARDHTHAFFNMYATAIFMGVADIRELPRPFALITSDVVVDDVRTVELDFTATNMRLAAGGAAVITESWFKFSNEPAAIFNPATAEADGWQVYTGPFTMPADVQYVHWFAANTVSGITGDHFQHLNGAFTHQGNIRVAETPFPPSAINISNAPAVLRRNTSVTLNATVLPTAAPQELIWSSSNPAAATVSQDGVVTARVASGVVVITARTPAGQVVTSVTIRLSM